jgi:hypothetical protein
MTTRRSSRTCRIIVHTSGRSLARPIDVPLVASVLEAPG